MQKVEKKKTKKKGHEEVEEITVSSMVDACNVALFSEMDKILFKSR